MKLKYFASAIMAMALAGCSNNDDVLDNNQQQESANDVAYMRVNIASVNDIASRGTSGDYTEGSESEHQISNAYFYFYNQDGSYNQVVSLTPGNNDQANDDEVQNNTGNIEYLMKPTLVIEKTSDRTPRFMVVVLNQPTDGSLVGLNLQNATKAVTEKSVYADNNFVMTNVSYVADANSDCADKGYHPSQTGYYYATPLAETDFHEEPSGGSINSDEAVDVYVERLAVKVSLNNKGNDYKVQIPNGQATTQDTYYTVKILGWALNGTEKQSYMMKNINSARVEDWNENFTATNWDKAWNNAKDHRSYWGESVHYNYQANNYPATFAAASEDGSGFTVSDGDVENAKLNYVNWNTVSNSHKDTQTSEIKYGEAEYCMENMLSETHLTNNLTGSATSVIVAAQIVTRTEDGTNLDLFRWGNVMWGKEDIINELMKKTVDIGTEDTPNYKRLSDFWTYNSTSDTPWNQMEATAIDFENIADGYVSIKLAKGNASDYSYHTIGDENSTFTSAADDLNKVIAAINTALAENPINGYKEGMMYYNIPIEHLAKFKDNKKYNDEDYSAAEGQYGVVRNHWYQITINKVTNLGKGVYDPAEDIIPNDTDSKLYYLGAEIKVLSWHIVNQDVNL